MRSHPLQSESDSLAEIPRLCWPKGRERTWLSRHIFAAGTDIRELGNSSQPTALPELGREPKPRSRHAAVAGKLAVLNA